MIRRSPRGFWWAVVSFLFLGLACSEPDSKDTPAKKVYLAETDLGYRLVREGRPFFVKGACVGDAHWKDFKKAGGNTIRIYDPSDLRKKLDRADSLGLMVAVDIPLPRYRLVENQEEFAFVIEEYTQQIKALVKHHKDHPALLFWILGNEIHYPGFFKGKKYFEQYNSWVSLIHKLDPDHPVTTTISGMSRMRTINMLRQSSGLDFLSFNIFGALSSAEERLQLISTFWDGPFMITEWGVNGPWEARENTSWGAPLEETSTKKAEQTRERYQMILDLAKNRVLGSFYFYWGQKQERTPTWFSAYLPDGRPTQVVNELSGLWNKGQNQYMGPKLGYILLEGMGAPSSITLPSSKEVAASIHKTIPDPGLLDMEWEIRPEHWFNWKSQKGTDCIPTVFKSSDAHTVHFLTPEEEGPYRLFLYLGDNNGNVATTNIPFYVLNPEYAE